jgi:hypothetical protein
MEDEMDVVKALTFVIEDKNWVAKLMIGGVIIVVPILNFAWLGYMTQIIRNVMAGSPAPLPDWRDNFGNYFQKGLLMGIAYLIYWAPILVLAVFYAIMAWILQDHPDVSFFGVVLLMACTSVFSLLIFFILPAVNINFARHQTLSSCFDIKEITKFITRNFTNYVIMLVVIALGTALVQIALSGLAAITSWVVCIGQVVSLIIGVIANVYTFVVYAYLMGKLGLSSELNNVNS